MLCLRLLRVLCILGTRYDANMLRLALCVNHVCLVPVRQILVDLGQDADVDVKYWADKYS